MYIRFITDRHLKKNPATILMIVSFSNQAHAGKLAKYLRRNLHCNSFS